METRRGLIFTISGPSGVGKGTIVKRLLEEHETVCVSVSATTRAPRAGEAEGVSYYFKSEREFDEMIGADQLLEWASVHGHRYGTPRDAVERMLAAGKDVILEIDVQGSGQVMKKNPEIIGIFILPPDAETLVRRLQGRGTESAADIALRMKNAVGELETGKTYPYCVVNGELESAVERVYAIIEAEHQRAAGAQGLIASLIESLSEGGTKS